METKGISNSEVSELTGLNDDEIKELQSGDMRFVKRRYEANTLHIQIHQQPIVPLLQPIEVLPFVEGRFHLVVKAVERGDDGLYVVLIDLEGDVYAHRVGSRGNERAEDYGIF